MAKQDGGNAFPLAAHSTQISDGIWTATPAQSGMSLRDYFAAQALQGIAANPARIVSWETGATLDEAVQAMAECAYVIADAMLTARDK